MSTLIHSESQLLKTSNVLASSYHPQTNLQVKQCNRALTYILRCYVNGNQQIRDLHGTTLTKVTNSQIHRYLNMLLLDLVLIRKIAHFILESTVSSGMVLTAAEKWAWFLATLQHSLHRTCASFQPTHKRYKRDFDQRFYRGREKIRTGYYVFFHVLHGVTKRHKVEHAFEGPLCVLQQDQHTLVIPHRELVERIAGYSIALAPQPTSVSPIPSEPASAMDIQDKNVVSTPRLFHRISDYYLDDDVQFEFLFNWGLHETTWEPRKSVPEKNSFLVFCIYALSNAGSVRKTIESELPD